MYPVLLNLQKRPVLVVGGGKIAARKINVLVQQGAVITVIAPELSPLIDVTMVYWINKQFEPRDLEGYSLVFACTDQVVVNNSIKALAKVNHWVNHTGDKYNSDFYNMKVIDVSGVLFAISTKGYSAQLAKIIGESLEIWAQENVPKLIHDTEMRQNDGID